MQRFYEPIADAMGNLIVSGSVTVTFSDTGMVVPQLYNSDGSPKANPFPVPTSGTTAGIVDFLAPKDGVYDVRVYSALGVLIGKKLGVQLADAKNYAPVATVFTGKTVVPFVATGYAIQAGQYVVSPGNGQQYLAKTTGTYSVDPASDSTNFEPVPLVDTDTLGNTSIIDGLGDNTAPGAPTNPRIQQAAINGEDIDVLAFISRQYQGKVLRAAIGDQEDFTTGLKAGSAYVVEKAKAGAVPAIRYRAANWYVSGNLHDANAKAVGFKGAVEGGTTFFLRPEFNGNLVTVQSLGMGPSIQRANATTAASLLRTGCYVGDFQIIGDQSSSNLQNGVVTYGTVDEFVLNNIHGKYLHGSLLRLGDWLKDGSGNPLGNGCVREGMVMNIGAHMCGWGAAYPSMLVTNRDNAGGVGDGTNQIDFYKIKLAFPGSQFSKLLDIANYHRTRVLRRLNWYGLQVHGAYQLGTTPDDPNFFDRLAHLLAIRGNCDGIEIYGLRTNGAGPTNASYCFVIIPIDDALASQGPAQNIKVEGNFSNTDFGALISQGQNIVFDTTMDCAVETVRIGPSAGPNIGGKITFRRPQDSAKIFIDASVRSNVDLYEDFINANNPLTSVALSQPSSINTSSPSTAALAVSVTGNTQPSLMATAYISGAGTGGLRLRHARNTSTSPQALSSGDAVGTIAAHSHDGSAFNSVGSLVIETNEAHDSTHHGTRLIVSLVPSGGSTTVGEVGRWSGLGSLSVGTTTVDANSSFIAGKPIRHIGYTVATLPSTGLSNGMQTYATDGRKVGEGAGAGTGVPVYRSNSAWRVYSTDAAVAA